MKNQFKVLTFNTWMLRTPIGLDIAEDIDERARLLPEKCAATGADVILFQENWDPVVRSILKRELARLGYPYEGARADVPVQTRVLGMTSITAAAAPLVAAHQSRARISRRGFLKGGALLLGTVGLNAAGAGSMALDSFRRSMGNGLQIFSRYPLGPTEQFCFSTFTRADEATVIKGAIKASVAVPGLGDVDCYTTHLGAVSFDAKNRRENATQCAARLAQARELAQWFQRTRVSPIAVFGGDFNMHYFQYLDGRYTDRLAEEYVIFTRELGLRDTYRELHGWQEPPAITDDIRNPYKARGHFEDSPDSVIDYVFVTPTPRLVTVASEVVFQEPITDYECRRHRMRRRPERLSDHYGVLTTFEIRPKAGLA